MHKLKYKTDIDGEDFNEIETHQLLKFYQNIEDETLFGEYLAELLEKEPEPFLLLSSLVLKYTADDSFPKNLKDDFMNSLSEQLIIMINLLDHQISEYEKIFISKNFDFCLLLVKIIVDREDFEILDYLINSELESYDGSQKIEPFIPDLLILIDASLIHSSISTIISNENWNMYLDYLDFLVEEEDLRDYIIENGCETIVEYYS
uniref:Uncharacterized protein n=1 Tax=viral metagenome TaxID=1070528 RepID=A0A6C0BCX9_9ZZZZ